MEKINYDKKLDAVIENLSQGERPSVLLQCCCGPCSSAVLERLCRSFKVTAYFYNPNIHPKAEYEKRLENERLLLENMHFADDVSLYECEYDGARFYEAVRGLENEPEGGARCAKCFELRLKKTAETAKKLGCDYFCTTLTVSPHKNADVINKIGNRVGEEAGVKFLPSDFKKKEGYKRSIELSRQAGLYRQTYCGCEFSQSGAKINE